MVFHSANFFIFLIVLLVLFYPLRKGRIALLAAANAIFYGASGLGALAVFFAATLLTFIIVHAMRRPGREWLFWVGLALNLANLGFFKYTLFILETIAQLTGWTFWFYDTLAAKLVLPVGISFYTFQLISYLIDVRRGDAEPTRSFWKFWVFISLFPQLVAGPIMRGDELLPQLDEIEKKRVRWPEIKYGLYLVLVGLIKKIVFADSLAQMVDPLFAKGLELTAVEAWQAAYLFGFQIYFDFSAYSDMALGLGLMLGVKLVVNFDSPYISGSPSEFWRRWHISLSRWIRDYVYISLGGNRRGPLRVQFNLLAAMMLSGLWHGAMWTFVLWGFVHGMLQVVYRWTRALNRWAWIDKLRRNWLYRIAAIFVFYHIVTWTWVFFRAQSLEQALYMSWTMLTVDVRELFSAPGMIVVAALYCLHVLEYVIRHYERQASRIWHWVPFPLRSAAYAGLALCILYFLKGETYDFIYFQF